MKIAHVISTFLPQTGGAQVCVHHVARRHAEDGDEVSVFVPRRFQAWSGQAYEVIGLAPATVKLFDFSFDAGKRYLISQVNAWQKRRHFDVWQVTIGYPWGAALVDFFVRSQIPCVLRCSGEDIQIHEASGYGIRRRQKADERVRRAYPAFNACVAISQEMVRAYEACGVSSDKIALIPNGAVSIPSCSPEEKRALRRQLGWPDKAPVLLTVGRYHPKKRFDIIPEVFRRIQDQCPGLRWMVIGEGNETLLSDGAPMDRNGLEIIGRIGLEPGEKDLPSQRLTRYYQAADLFVFPTAVETFGIVVAEAMAAGLPVVTTAAPGVEELVQEGVSGRKVRPDDVEALAGAIRDLLSNEKVRSRMARAAKERARPYHWERVARQYRELYAKVVNQGRSVYAAG